VDAPTGSVLNPMHPVPKVKGLTPGKRWRMPILNPLGDAVEPALKALWAELQPNQPFNFKLPAGPKFVDAEVLTEIVEVEYNGRLERCRVIEYRGEDQPARTYVRIEDGAVIRQEAFALGEKIALQRE